MTAAALTLALEYADGGLPIDVAVGLDLLSRSPPLWPIDADEWSAAVATVWAFADRWDGLARAAGWETAAALRSALLRAVRSPGRHGPGVADGAIEADVRGGR